MNYKLITKVISRNLFFLIFTIITTVYVFRDVNQVLYAPATIGMVNIKGVKFTLFFLQIDVVQGTFKKIYTIFNYPLIPLFLGSLYNIYMLFKIFINNRNNLDN